MYIECTIPEGMWLKSLEWHPVQGFNAYLQNSKTFRGSRGKTAQEAVDSAAAILRATSVHYDEPAAPAPLLSVQINLAHLVRK